MSVEWLSAEVLEFIELFKLEPCLWDTRLTINKNRTAHSEAWQRISKKLSFPMPVEELKKKKESLMGYYRIHSNRYKKSLESGNKNEIYKTNWFAYDVMDSFLSPIYGPKPRQETKEEPAQKSAENMEKGGYGLRTGTPTPEGARFLRERRKTRQDDVAHSVIAGDDGASTSTGAVAASYTSIDGNGTEETTSEYSDVDFESKSMSISTGHWSNNDYEATSAFGTTIPKIETITFHDDQYLEPEEPPEINEDKNQLNEAHEQLESVTSRKRELDEYDHFAFMIAAKIRKFQNPDDREILMNAIQNFTFDFYMRTRQKTGPAQNDIGNAKS